MKSNIKDIDLPGGDVPDDAVPADDSVELMSVSRIREVANSLHSDIIREANAIHAEIEDLCSKTEEEQTETGCLGQLQELYESIDQLAGKKEFLNRQFRLTEGYADWFCSLLRELTADNPNEKNEAPLSDDSLIRLSAKIAKLAYEIPARQNELDELNRKIEDLEKKHRKLLELESLDNAIAERKAQIAELDRQIAERNEELKKVYAPPPPSSEPTPHPAPTPSPAPAPKRTAPMPGVPPKVRVPAPEPASAGTATRQLTIRSERTGSEIRVGSGTRVSSNILNRLGENFKMYYDGEGQFEVRFTDGAWQLIPCPGTTNKTFVNGVFVPDSTPVTLNSSDTVAVGNPTTNKTALPIQITFALP